MANTLLRSGDIKDFQALGQDGKAVYLFATQIRDTFRIKLGQQYANHLAIPQRNDQGNIIDWYIPFASTNPDGGYDIVPWSAANEQEKNAALITLYEFEQKVIGLGKMMTSNVNLSGDQLLFSRLVYNPQASKYHDDRENIIAIRFPAAEFVYIVNGIPVITFWGFLSHNQQVSGSVFRCLEPLKAAVVTPELQSAPIPLTTPAAEPIKRRAWWRSWWWLLLPLLLLLLLFFLLRGCSPKLDVVEGGSLSLPSVTLPDVGLDVTNNPDVQVPALNGGALTVPTIPNVNGSVNVPALTDDGEIVNSDSSSNQPDVPIVDVPVDDTVATDLPSQNIPPLDDNSNVNGDSNDANALQNDDESNGDANLLQQPNNPSALGNKLTFPSDALKDGSTEFLNGKWNVSSGIQDKETGKPLRLEYQFDKGNGTVTITNSDGVKCVGNVGTGIAQGNLNINNKTSAVCGDNSTYSLPQIKCVPGKDNVANCQGDYGNGDKFPITIKQQPDN